MSEKNIEKILSDVEEWTKGGTERSILFIAYDGEKEKVCAGIGGRPTDIASLLCSTAERNEALKAALGLIIEANLYKSENVESKPKFN